MRSRYPFARHGGARGGGAALRRGLRSGLAGLLAVVAAGLTLELAAAPAHAQFPFFGNNYSRQPPPRPRQGIPQRPQQYQQPVRRAPVFGFPFFGGGPSYSYPSYRGYPNDPDEVRRRQQQQQQQRVDSSRAPAHRRPDTEPPKHVLVLGDSMADWLGYGLEEAFFEANELGVIRRHRTGSGLIRNEPRDYDWVQGARDSVAGERADFVVMMIGLNDRHAIRERPSQAPRESAPNQPNIPGPERERAVSHEFRSEKWIELYGKRVDEAIAALKAKRVPVIWVGLPPVRVTKTRADLAFINDLQKERAERAGIIYVDVWEGFLDEEGDFSNFGPDVLGQVRRLRAGDGVHFTRQGARKLAHFVDREIQRLLSRETPVALPAPEEPAGPAPAPAPDGPPPRPLAGPVVALTGGAPVSEPLIGGRPQDTQVGDPLAVRVLVRGEPPAPQPGRADSFAWPPAHQVAANDVAAPPPEPSVAAIRGATPSRRTPAAVRPVLRRPAQAATRPPARAVQ